LTIKAIKSGAFGVTFVDVDRILDEAQNGKATVTTVEAYRLIGVVNRCVDLRMEAVANVPFTLLQGETEVATSADWSDPTGGLPSPRHILSLIEGALCIWGVSYLSKVIDSPIFPGLRYLLPTSLNLDTKALTRGEIQFKRQLRKQYSVTLTPDDLIYLWGKDPTIEIGPPRTSPVYAALHAAGIVAAFDEFSEQFARGGMIKTTLLGLPEGTSQAEQKRVENIFQRLYTGVANAFKIKVINADAIKPTIIGGGFEELGDGKLLTQQEERVARDMGVMASLLFSNAANYATAQQDTKNFLLYTIIPDCNDIAEVLNRQWYNERGYSLVFTPQAMTEFQADEKERSSAYKTYIDAGMSPSIAAEMLGLTLPSSVTYQDLDPQPAPVSIAPAVDTPADEEPAELVDTEAQTLRALRTWRKFALKRYTEKHPAKALDFVSPDLPIRLHAQVMHGLSHCEDVTDVKIAFGLATKLVTIGGEDDATAPSVSSDEARMARQIKGILNSYQADAVAYVTGETEEEPDYTALYAALYAVLIAHFITIATDRINEMETELALTVDEGPAVMAWSATTAQTTARELTETTRASVNTARQSYTPDMTPAQVLALLHYGFSPSRPELIAISETTDALSEAALIYAALIGVLGVSSQEIWNTREDEKVCPICGPLHGTRRDVWGERFPTGPTAHPRCRCWLSLRIE
jgi:hypothetical protein